MHENSVEPRRKKIYLEIRTYYFTVGESYLAVMSPSPTYQPRILRQIRVSEIPPEALENR